MNEIQLNQLIRIFNTLKLVNTCGEDTIIMAQCLTSFKDLLEDVQKKKD